ncbi:MAG: shikimate kinase [Verrucomicrobiae bacterium]|nr:shikimate kinase [Verrucomicrobiae bacterium]
MPNTKNIVLIGMMGSGKSTIGYRAAQELNLTFYDLDKEIEKKAHCTIAEIFQQEGEAAFRELEHEILQELLQKNLCVIATGGGTFCEKRNRDLLKKYCITFYLNASTETLFERTRHTSHRPLLQTENPLATLKNLMQKRQAYYEQADYILNVENLAPTEIVQQLISLYRTTS